MKLFAFFKKKKTVVFHKSEAIEIKRLENVFATLKYWSPELIEFIANNNDPLQLAVASCLVNTYRWPDWLPGRPEKEKGEGMNFFCTEVYQLLHDKCEKLCPGLYSKIWLTKYYLTFKR